MGLKFWKRRKEEKPKVEESPKDHSFEPTTGTPGAQLKKMGFEGKPFHTNLPTPALLERKERRLETVNKLVREKFKKDHPRYKEFMRIKHKLALEIKLIKGDY